VNLRHDYTGACRYVADHKVGPDPLLIALPCLVGGVPDEQYGLLDSGSYWCVLPQYLRRALGCEPERSAPVARISTRFGLFEGWLERLSLEFPAIIGEPYVVEATWFVSLDWPGPMVLGWKGCLERFRWAIDPEEEAFYFAPPGSRDPSG
jgi:hypothetical protein